MIDIAGPERLSLQAASIAPESACTSMQLHLQVSPADFANNWNAAQVLAGPQLALGANSPYFFGHQLWAETRIELFAQATDTRPDELKTQGVRPRVWFGERWITSIFDLFEENVRYFPSLLPELSDEDPVAELAAGRTPRLPELRLHNGTIYRWNRPVYDVVDGRPHLRVENRVLPAGPTVVDMMANSAFYYGLLRTLSEEDRPLWTKLSFAAAEHNFLAAAQHGMDARLYWPGLGEVTPDELVLRQLLPMAEEGLRRWGVAADVRDRYLGVIEGRAKTGRNGVGVAGRDGRRAAGARTEPAQRAGRDAAAVLRTDALQRAGAHLGRAGLSGRSCNESGCSRCWRCYRSPAAGQRTAEPTEAGLGRPFVLQGGQQVTITGEDLRLRFAQVLEDSRCPELVECILDRAGPHRRHRRHRRCRNSRRRTDTRGVQH